MILNYGMMNNMKTRMYLSIFVVFILSCFFLNAQAKEIEVTKLTREELPQEISIPGKLIEALSWKDKNGTNYFVQCSAGPYTKSYEDRESDIKKEIFAEQFVNKDGKIDSIWGFDYKRECVMSLELKFIPNSVYVTDLDSNGITETTFVYKTASRSDVSPADIELIMHENKNKYSLKGTSFIRYSSFHEAIDLKDYEYNLETAVENKLNNDVFSGRFEHAHDFDNAPKQFLEFAIEKWKIHVNEPPY